MLPPSCVMNSATLVENQECVPVGAKSSGYLPLSFNHDRMKWDLVRVDRWPSPKPHGGGVCRVLLMVCFGIPFTVVMVSMLCL